MNRWVAVLDIDGVIADARHRLHFIQQEPKNWDAFYAAVGEDEVLATGYDLAHSLATRYEIVYLTGRRKSTELDTLHWLRRHHLPNGRLLMRPDGDYRPAATLKLELLGQHLIGRTVTLVVDDDPGICDALEAAGNTVLQACWARPELLDVLRLTQQALDGLTGDSDLAGR